jgi:mono/diheme cytochrome c family protein
MSMFRVIAAALAGCWVVGAADLPAGDAARGEQIFQNQHCVQCHSLNGNGGKLGGDLSRIVDRDYTPAVMASLMWNHAPDMWSAIRKNGMSNPHLSVSDAADLFAFFVSARYFEKPGDAGRGKLAFQTKHCADCHGISSSPVTSAPPVAKWESLADPVVLAQQMWNHGARMRSEFASKKIAWGEMTAQELTDMLVYLQNLPETKAIAHNFLFPPSDTGASLFQSKGCAGCHTGKLALENRLKNQTLTEIAVDMWNHQPSMKPAPPEFSQEEMRQLLAFVWMKQYFRGSGSADHGKSVFDKNCAACHNDAASGAPKLAGHKDAYSDITIISTLWGHGPQMLDSMTQRHMAWPRFTAQQMSDLIAYLNAQ